MRSFCHDELKFVRALVDFLVLCNAGRRCFGAKLNEETGTYIRNERVAS